MAASSRQNVKKGWRHGMSEWLIFSTYFHVIVHIKPTKQWSPWAPSKLRYCGRIKDRIFLSSYGTGLNTVSSVREALIAIYDTLEITRYLCCKHNILHRDISYGNVSIKPAPQESNFRTEGGIAVSPDAFCSTHVALTPHARVITRFPVGVVHNELPPLRSLLREIGKHIQCDHYWAEDENLMHPEYVHEVFQRLIFNFLIEHRNEPFMDVPLKQSSRPSNHSQAYRRYK
ncbi:hypothetical protein BDZ97DRAFT_1755530 [Flammula alnicola]|nr:hypothetical protein BDZ97DRAFT_1755530 [Flammula alnicola]